MKAVVVKIQWWPLYPANGSMQIGSVPVLILCCDDGGIRHKQITPEIEAYMLVGTTLTEAQA